MRENLPAWANRLHTLIKQVETLATLCTQKLIAGKNRLLDRITFEIEEAIRPYRFKPQPSRPLDFLQFIAIALYAPILFFAYAGDKHGYSVFFSYAVYFISVVIFVIESIRLGKRFAHWKTAAKAFYAALAVAFGFIASSLAKNYANNVTQIDPKYLSDFTGLLTVLITWIFVLTMIPIGVLMLSAFRLMATQLYMLLLTVIQLPLSSVHPKIGRLPDYIWQLLTGDTAEFPKFRFFMLPAFHFLGAAISCAVLLAPLSLLSTYRIQIGTLLTQLLVLMDYRPNHGCDAATASRVVFLERGYVSVATQTGDGYRFSVIHCDFKTSK